MSWSVRHEGSPEAVTGLQESQVVEGLLDGVWEPTDEVRGPDDPDWQAIESHPRFEEICLDIEPPPPRHYDDETRLDMTPLIDVCLVLLIFFIMTMTYSALLKYLEAGDATSDKGAEVVQAQDVDKTMIKAVVTMEAGKPVFKIDDETVARDNLGEALRRAVSRTRKTILLLDHQKEVPHGAVTEVQAAARLAGIEEIKLLVPPDELRKSQPPPKPNPLPDDSK